MRIRPCKLQLQILRKHIEHPTLAHEKFDDFACNLLLRSGRESLRGRGQDIIQIGGHFQQEETTGDSLLFVPFSLTRDKCFHHLELSTPIHPCPSLWTLDRATTTLSGLGVRVIRLLWKNVAWSIPWWTAFLFEPSIVLQHFCMESSI